MSWWVEPNDTLSAIKLSHYNADTGIGAANFYEWDNCGGRQGFLMAGDAGVPKGYNLDDMEEHNIMQYFRVRSVRIPLGYTVELYDRPNFRGFMRSFQG